MQDFIRTLKQKPEPVRRRIAVGASAGVTGLVAIIWMTAMTASGAFALNTEAGSGTKPKAPSSDAFALSGTNVSSNMSQLVGAVNAATGATTSQPSLTIVDGTTTSSIDETPPAPSNTNNTSATVIPF